MNETVIGDIAHAVAIEQFHLQWPFYALLLAMTLVLGFGAAFIGAYAKSRGEALATKADFDDLLKQLKATTAAAEEVKTQILHADWASREMKRLRRTKLEELVKAMHDSQVWQEAERNFVVYGIGVSPGPSKHSYFELLVGLYFPELSTVAYAFTLPHRQIMAEAYGTKGKILNAKDADEHLEVVRQSNKSHERMYAAQVDAMSKLQARAREVMAQLVGTRATSEPSSSAAPAAQMPPPIAPPVANSPPVPSPPPTLATPVPNVK